MGFTPQFPVLLAGADFILVRCALDLQAPCRVDLVDLLGLRPTLARVGRELLGESRSARLFAPPLSADPQALRRFQKPAPPFVLRPDPAALGAFLAGDRVELEVLFLGTGIQLLADFIEVLRHLGRCGLPAGGGEFAVSEISCLGIDGGWQALEQVGRSRELAPSLLTLGDWLDAQWLPPAPLVMELVTPARLVAGGRTLRRPQFVQLFPFLLRRITSLLHYHCGLEPVPEPDDLLAAAARVVATWESSRWVDWREVGGESLSGRIGGVSGVLRLDGDGLEEIGWLLALATLFGVGRGATYGAGRLRLAALAETCERGDFGILLKSK